MRSAVVIARIDRSLLDFPVFELGPKDGHGRNIILRESISDKEAASIQAALHRTNLRRSLIDQLKQVSFSICGTRFAIQHTDNLVDNVTIKIILQGNHVLCTGNGRFISELFPGTVYLLDNKKHHGTKPRSRHSLEPLIFLSAGLSIPYSYREIIARTSPF